MKQSSKAPCFFNFQPRLSVVVPLQILSILLLSTSIVNAGVWHNHHPTHVSSLLNQDDKPSKNNNNNEKNHQNNHNIKSAYEYVPITALNQYGQSTQLRHAQLASSRYGALTLAAIATLPSSSKNKNDPVQRVIVCCTLPNPSPPGIKRNKHTNNSSPSSLLQILAHDTSSSNPNQQRITAMIGSGVKPDIQFVVQKLRDYSRRIWERYDVTPSPSRLSAAVSEICTSFMGYNVHDEITDGVGPVLLSNGNDDDDEDDREPMARPLGIQVLMVGVLQSNVEMISIDAAGVQTPCQYWAMGKDGEDAYKLLQERWDENMTLDDLKQVMQDIVKEIRFVEEEDQEKEKELFFEVLSGRGIALSQMNVS